MTALRWSDVAEDVAAGSVTDVLVVDDFTRVELTVYYGNGKIERRYRLQAHGLRYIDLRRLCDHEAGVGMILEAYLHTNSPLLDAIHSGRLDPKPGVIADDDTPLVHLEILGEVSVNVVCANVTAELTDELVISTDQ